MSCHTYQEVSDWGAKSIEFLLRSIKTFLFRANNLSSFTPFRQSLSAELFFSDPMMLSLLPRDCSSMRRNMIRCMERRKGKISSTFCEGADGQGNSE